MYKLTLNVHRSEEDILFSIAAAHIQDQTKIKHSGTCFAGMGKICNYSLIPNPRKADQLRKQKYW